MRGMKTETAVNHFGGVMKLADALGITRQAVHRWGGIIPEGVAYKLQVMTAGRLVVDPAVYEKRNGSAQGNAQCEQTT